MNFVIFEGNPARRGRPPSVAGARRDRILQVARQRFETPSTKDLAIELGMSVSTVQRIICEELRRLRGGRK